MLVTRLYTRCNASDRRHPGSSSQCTPCRVYTHHQLATSFWRHLFLHVVPSNHILFACLPVYFTRRASTPFMTADSVGSPHCSRGLRGPVCSHRSPKACRERRCSRVCCDDAHASKNKWQLCVLTFSSTSFIASATARIRFRQTLCYPCPSVKGMLTNA